MRGDVQGVDKSATAEAGASKEETRPWQTPLWRVTQSLDPLLPTRLQRKAQTREQRRPPTLAPHGPRPRGHPPVRRGAGGFAIKEVIPSPEAAADKGTGTTVQLEAPTAQAGAARSFGEGLVKVGLDSQVAAQGDAPNAAGISPVRPAPGTG